MKSFKDKNGLKCHLNSEGHRLKLADYERNKDKYKSEKSDKLEKEFMSLLKAKYINKKILLSDFLIDFNSNKIILFRKIKN